MCPRDGALERPIKSESPCMIWPGCGQAMEFDYKGMDSVAVKLTCLTSLSK